MAWFHQLWKILYLGWWSSSVPGSCCCLFFVMIVCIMDISFPNPGGEGDVLMVWTSRSAINRFASMGLMGDPTAGHSVHS